MKIRKKSFRLILGVVILMIFSMASLLSAANATPKNYIETMVDNFPTPQDNEFSDPEMVIKSYIDAIRNNDMDLLFKCHPMSEYYKANTMENFVKKLKYYYASTPIPNYDLQNYLQLLKYCLEPVNRIIVLGLYADTPDFDRIVMFSPLLPVPIDLEKEAGQKKLDEVKEMIDMGKLKKNIGPITITKQITMDLDDMDEEMGITEKKLIITTLKIGKSYQLGIEFRVGKLNKNWRVTSVIFE